MRKSVRLMAAAVLLAVVAFVMGALNRNAMADPPPDCDVLCIEGYHQTPAGCRCVPDDPADRCDTVALCIEGYRWSSQVCGCIPDRNPDCYGPDKVYVSRDPEECAVILFSCSDGQEPFFDECGCGCVVQP